jgi:hypothetical protein
MRFLCLGFLSMHAHMVFHNPPALPHPEVVAILERALREPSASHESAAADALIGSALADEDGDFVEHWCVQVGTRAAGSNLLGLAALCLGHTARRFRHLSPAAIALAMSLAARAESDPASVGAQALDGRDDILGYLDPAATDCRCGSGRICPCHGGAHDRDEQPPNPA